MSVGESSPEPNIIPGTLSALCSLLMRPMIMTGVFREILISHFASERYIEEPSLKELVWHPGTDSSILIESVHRWRPQLTELRPAVIIKRNTCANMRRGIGDRRQGNPVDRFGDPHYVTFWQGSHTLFCIGSTGAQAEYLASEVSRELVEFGPVILETLGLLRFQVTEIGAVGELEEATENFTVPVTVGYGYEERWVIHQQAPTIRRLSLSLILEC